jgi:hypothetical protein
VRRDGIHFQGLRYIDATLAAYVGEAVTIRFDPRDVSEIRVFHQNRFLCRAVSPEYADRTVTLRTSKWRKKPIVDLYALKSANASGACWIFYRRASLHPPSRPIPLPRNRSCAPISRVTETCSIMGAT